MPESIASSRRTFCNASALLSRAALISRMVILSTSSPQEIGALGQSRFERSNAAGDESDCCGYSSTDIQMGQVCRMFEMNVACRPGRLCSAGFFL
jgi:hypothetical protein